MDAAKLFGGLAGKNGKYRITLFEAVKSAKISDMGSRGLDAVLAACLFLTGGIRKMLPFKVPGGGNDAPVGEPFLPKGGLHRRGLCPRVYKGLPGALQGKAPLHGKYASGPASPRCYDRGHIGRAHFPGGNKGFGEYIPEFSGKRGLFRRTDHIMQLPVLAVHKINIKSVAHAITISVPCGFINSRRRGILPAHRSLEEAADFLYNIAGVKADS